MNIRVWLTVALLSAVGVLVAARWRTHAASADQEEPAVPRASAPNPPPPELRPGPLRPPAVAGAFYPADKDELARTIDGFLAKAAVSGEKGRLCAIVCPHAGYAYCGQTAAFSYKQLIGRAYRTVILLGPSHFAAFDGAYIAPVAGYTTPLGVVPLSGLAPELAKVRPFVSAPEFRAEPPSWAPRNFTAADRRPDMYEHSIEVEVPFLQTVLKNFAIVPIVYGPEVDPAEVAAALQAHLDEQTLLVISTDLSHFYTDAVAKKLDQACVEAVCKLDEDALATQEACGLVPLQTLVKLAKQKHWRPKLLDARNSSAATGDTSRVVGYAAIAFYAAADAVRPSYSAAERAYLLDLARQALTAAVKNAAAPAPKDVPPALQEQRACFVTLTEDGNLRGCIGHLGAREPLYQDVVENARNAGLEDPRFTPVTSDELSKIHIEVSVLTQPVPLPFTTPDDLLQKLRPQIDGVVLKLGGRQATFLPQVWEELPEKEEFLKHLSRKAGCPEAAWRQPGTEVLIYHAEAFAEAR